MNIGVPNPELLTFMDITGDGEVEVIVNGEKIDNLDLCGGRATASDIALEMGYNHVLLLWRAASGKSELSLAWRNIMRQPETTFKFF